MSLSSYIHVNTRSIHIERNSETGSQPYILTSRAMQVLARVADTLGIPTLEHSPLYTSVEGPSFRHGCRNPASKDGKLWVTTDALVSTDGKLWLGKSSE